MRRARQLSNSMFSQKSLYKCSGMRPCIIVHENPCPRSLQMWSYMTDTFQDLAVKLTVDNLTDRKKFLVDYALTIKRIFNSGFTLEVSKKTQKFFRLGLILSP
ncbi:hypothetical protein AVEN_175272-1 [Araneus ventricosus]|uniref:Uncharacterized protein n=1 Tax=Araneus ventricosus TaxID=182803 RepID=A0A4Y2EY65_ARAVE|nr:hypothetical protein AVEN_175272-1 [Araneus ventricosus]